MSGESRTAEQVLAGIAGGAHGIVTRGEALDAGLSAAQIDWRIEIGALIIEHRGVFRVGHAAPSIEATYMAAVRAGGEGTRLRGRAAGHLLGLLRRPPSTPQVLTATQRRIGGVSTRRARHDDGCDVITWKGIPVTSVARTLVDLAAELDEDELARACHEAGVRHRTTPRQVERVLGRRPNSPGAAMLRRILRGDTRVNLSKLESRFLERLREAGLPLPVTNRLAGGRRVDCRWPEHGLTVELDSYRYHGSRHAWEKDRRREREAYARGDDFRRYTWDDVNGSPRLMLRELRSLLAS